MRSLRYTWADARPKGCTARGDSPTPVSTAGETCDALKNRRWSPWQGDYDKWKNCVTLGKYSPDRLRNSGSKVVTPHLSIF
ncbi:hypothetical protein M427DRAFT_257072 [Gonapodya prolifera JEL478]|uniref:Uncharacterized protein n=1 Tax=Gonapodya prolifera (strain JEL478) TaxID=1344416 RepID=A0A138ZX41_GONPJ|nr:hypothetical protein M427DRAFT_257072 [Gonapodya prolifera JEL478]|eukprot:KXS09082.1 hypothetical protein M427DRAFT_257072 [Gonapodya prolifera JEL478]